MDDPPASGEPANQEDNPPASEEPANQEDIPPASEEPVNQEDIPPASEEPANQEDNPPATGEPANQEDNPEQPQDQPQDQGSPKDEPASNYPSHHQSSPVWSSGFKQSAASTVLMTAGSPVNKKYEPKQELEQHPWHIWYGILAIVAVFMMMYIMWDFEQMHEIRFRTAHNKLKQAINQFPKNPQQYNALQLQGYYAQFWRRFNFRNISLTIGSVVTSLALAQWHRKKRVAFQSRKTLQFWLGTMTAGFLATVWGLYLMQQPDKHRLTMKALKANPMLRSGVYLAMIAISGTMLYCYRRQFQEKQRHRHHRRGRRTPKTKAKNVYIM